MKKLSKIISFVLLATILIVLITLISVRKSGILLDISEVYKSVTSVVVDFRNTDPVTVNFLVTSVTIIFFVLGIMVVIQVRRRKTPLLPILGLLAIIIAILGIILSKYFSNLQTTINAGSEKQQTLFALLKVSGLLIALEYVGLVVVNVPLAFEPAEFKPNSKKSEKMKLVDIIIASTIFVLFFGLTAVAFKNPFVGFGNSFVGLLKYFFSFGGSWEFPKTLIVPLGYFVMVGLVLLVISLIRSRKSLVAPLYFIFIVLLTFSLTHFNNEYGAGFKSLFEASKVLKSTYGLVFILYIAFAYAYFIYSLNDCIFLLFEPKRLKLYNHREKYVYGERRKFGQSVVKEWESMKKGVSSIDEIIERNDEPVIVEETVEAPVNLIGVKNVFEEPIHEEEDLEDEEVVEEEEDDDDQPAVVEPVQLPKEEIVQLSEENLEQPSFSELQPAKVLDIKEKLLSLEPEKQERYNIVRNKLQSYRKVKQRFSKTVDSYRYAGELVAKISVLGRTVRLHLALDPDSYEVSKYHHIDLSSKNKYIFVPFTLKLRSKRSVKYAVELIDELMTGFDIPVNPNYKEVDYMVSVKQLHEEEKL